MDNRYIRDVRDPSLAQDAATKAYADTKVAAASAALTGTPTAPTATGTNVNQIVNWTALQNQLGIWANFSPTLTWGGTTPTLTLPTVARRLIVGKMVYVQIYIYAGCSATKGTSLVITGLPGTLVTTMPYAPVNAIEQYYNSGTYYGDPLAYIDTSGGGSIKFRAFYQNVGAGDQVLTMMIEGFYEVA
jgi:hypothetical protein